MIVRINYRENGGLRRYTTEEYRDADFGDMMARAPELPTRTLMENLESLFYRGFQFDQINGVYFKPGTPIRVGIHELIRRGIWKAIDDVMESEGIDWCNHEWVTMSRMPAFTMDCAAGPDDLVKAIDFKIPIEHF